MTAPARSAAAEMLQDFHDIVGHPDTDALWLRSTLHDEEHAELVEALKEGDREHIARELADVVYVAYGTALAAGIDLDAAIEEVHRANMSKFVECEACGGDGCARHTPDGVGIMNDDWTIDMCEPCNGTGKVMLRRDDGKVLKGPRFSPPDMTQAVLDVI